ncbi:MAG: NAD(P)H-hydrate dehydratase [Candidatus Moranbacteria bacterium]|nr:NAD(P)H-hydrate dehydratase [Candidatus Moranbacteria bacterium]
MSQANIRAQINDVNARYYGVDIQNLMEKAGQGVANYLLKNFTVNKNYKIAIFCGLGNNGGDGLVAARYLNDKTKVRVFLLGSKQAINNPLVKRNIKLYKGKIFQIVNKKDLNRISKNYHYVIECLIGTGLKGEPRQELKALIKKINSLRATKITIDSPVPGFKYDLSLSLDAKKNKDAQVIDIDFPKKIKNTVGPGEIKALKQAKDQSHKGENGKILLIAGSIQYHGALLMAAKIAAKIVDLVYIYSNQENYKTIRKLKPKIAEFITTPKQDLAKVLKNIDSILIGPGLKQNNNNQKIVKWIFDNYADKKIILDATGLKMIEKKMLNKNCVLTPHAKEFQDLFKLKPTYYNAKQMAKKYDCIIVLKGKNDLIASKNSLKINTQGNAGLTKGGTGDVLAGMITALGAKNPLFLACGAAVFLNGLAADQLYQDQANFFSAEDLIDRIPKTYKWCLDF